MNDLIEVTKTVYLVKIDGKYLTANNNLTSFKSLALHFDTIAGAELTISFMGGIVDTYVTKSLKLNKDN